MLSTGWDKGAVGVNWTGVVDPDEGQSAAAMGETRPPSILHQPVTAYIVSMSAHPHQKARRATSLKWAVCQFTSRPSCGLMACASVPAHSNVLPTPVALSPLLCALAGLPGFLDKASGNQPVTRETCYNLFPFFC